MEAIHETIQKDLGAISSVVYFVFSRFFPELSAKISQSVVFTVKMFHKTIIEKFNFINTFSG